MRLFLALDLPAGAREAIGRRRDAVVTGRADLRPVADEALHVTLVFIGTRPAEMVERLWRAASGSLARLSAPTLTARGLEVVPPRRPRVLALELEDEGGRAAAVHEALSSALQGAGLHEPELRPFWPHVTVARVRRDAKVREGPWSPPPASIPPFAARRVTLYRSDLHPAGARYVALERLNLPT